MRSAPRSRSRCRPGWSFRPSASAREPEPMNTDVEKPERWRLWIPGSRASLGPRDDGPKRRPPFPLVARDEARGEPAQALQIDAARAHDVAHGEIDRCERHVLGKALVPACTQIRGGDELLQDRPARGLEELQCAANIVRMLRERPIERDRVLEGKSRAGPDGEMRGVERIP